jgi:hypothetical protein
VSAAHVSVAQMRTFAAMQKSVMLSSECEFTALSKVPKQMAALGWIKEAFGNWPNAAFPPPLPSVSTHLCPGVGKRFAIATHQMAKAGIIPNWSESRYRRAKNVLLEVGLLSMVKKGGGYAGASLFQLHRLPLTSNK